MPFRTLPAQAPMNPKADAYGAVALELSRSAASRLRTVLDLSYGPDPAHMLDLYLPADASLHGLPVLINLHGGGWTHGYKEWSGFNALPLVDLPCILVSIDYRLAPIHRMPASIEDTVDALAWVYRNIALFGGDPDRIFIGGHSAGGHLAASATLRRDLQAARGLPAGVIKGCFPVSCSYNFDYQNPQPGSGEEKTLRTVLASPADAKAMSPVNYVAGNKVPFFMSWGTEDIERAIIRGGEMLTALKAQPGHVEHHVFDTFDHFEIHLDQIRPENVWVKKVRSWMGGELPR